MSFLDPEAEIVARLTAQLEAHWPEEGKRPRIFTDADTANMKEKSQIAPSYVVMFDSYAPTQERGDGTVQEIEQSWLVWVVVKNGIRPTRADGVRKEAGPMIDLLLGALCGYKISDDFKPLKLSEGPGPDFSEPGFGFFPVRFKTRTTVRGST